MDYDIPSGTRPREREENTLRVLDVLIKHGPISRIDLSRKLGVARSTVSVIVNGLIEIGLVNEIGEQEIVGAGRPPTLLEIDATSRQFVCVDLDVGETSIVLCDLEGKVMAAKVDVMARATPEIVAREIIDSVTELLERENLDWATVAGVGVVVPGPVRHDIDTVQSLVFGWPQPVKLQAELRKCLPEGIPLLAENDVNAAAFAEWDAIGYPPDLFYVYVGRGIGSAYIYDGRLHYGRHFLAGEIGHMTVESDGVLCDCGNRGCLEKHASVPCIIAAIHGESALDRGRAYYQSSLFNLVRQLESGDSRSLAVVNEAGHAIGAALYNVIQVLDCEKIVLSGPICMLRDYIMDVIKLNLTKQLGRGTLSLAFSQVGEDAKAIGIASLMREAILLNTGGGDDTPFGYLGTKGAERLLRAVPKEGSDT